MKKNIPFLFALLLMFVLLAPASSQASANVDPRVLEDTANGAVSNFIVVLKSQAPVRAISASITDPIARGRVVYSALKQTADASQPTVRAQLDSLGVSYRAFYIVNAMAVEGNRAVVEALAARGDVQSIEPDRAFRVPLEQPESRAVSAPTTTEWNIDKINAPSLWNLGYTGRGIVYANADTGVQWDHPALKPHYRGWNGTTVDHNFNWWDAIKTQINPSGNSCGYDLVAPCDDFGHGTHTMGTGIGDDGAGNQIGVAPGAKWIACRNMDGGTGRPSTYISCYQFFLAPTDLNGNNANPDLRPDAVGNSYACPLGPPPQGEDCSITSLQDAITNLRAAGIFMSVSAGNSGSGCSTIELPALYDLSITIGATDSNDNIVDFSSRGPVTLNGITLTKPNLVAPGLNVRSSIPSDTYGYDSGTSMSAPHVAGAVALLWSAFPQLRRKVDVTEFILEQSAVHFTTSEGCGGDSSSQVPNNVYGYGRVDVMAAYNLALSTGFPPNRFFYLPLLMQNTAP